MGTGSKQQRYWLMKCEPAAYTIDDLARDGRAVPLDEIKRDAELDGILVGQKGNRLSIQPLSRTHFERIVELGNTVTF